MTSNTNRNNNSTGNTIYVMGVVPASTSEGATDVCILGVTRSSMYGNTPYKRTYFETFEVSGSETAQALEVVEASREFYPLALVLESPKAANPVAERIAFCIETSYVICPFFRHPTLQEIRNETIATTHALTFLRRAKSKDALRDSAWGPPERSNRTATRGSRASARKVR